MAGTARPPDQAEKVARKVWRLMLLPPEQRQKERREELERRLREQPETVAEEAHRRGALRFFLSAFSREQPRFLAELREIPPEPVFPPSRIAALQSISIRYHLPPTAAVAIECLKTLLMWQTFPDLPSDWHFERPEGALAHSLVSAKSAGPPNPFVFVTEGWNPNTETLDSAKKRLLRLFKATLSDKATFWKSAEIDQIELRVFEAYPSLETLRRNLECLAVKQAKPASSQQDLADRFNVTRHALRFGLFEAADLIGLPREKIRRAPPGAPRGVRHRRMK